MLRSGSLLVTMEDHDTFDFFVPGKLLAGWTEVDGIREGSGRCVIFAVDKGWDVKETIELRSVGEIVIGVVGGAG